MKIRMLLILTLIVLLLANCGLTVISGSGRLITETREVGDYNAVSFSGIGDLIITQGDAEGLTVEAEDNIMPYIVADVRSGTLFIRFNVSGWEEQIIPNRAIHFNLLVKDLTTIQLAGVGNIRAASLQVDRLAMQLDGTGNVKVERLGANLVRTTISGAGGATIAGQVTRQEVTVNGVGNYSAGDLDSQTARVEVNGAGGATIWVRDALEVLISGAGSVNYYGSPQITKNIVGIGVLKSLGEK